MSLLSGLVLREIVPGAALGVVLFTFVLFLERLRRLFELLVRASAAPEQVGYLLALVFPLVLPFAVPVGVLVGVLIGLSRMSSDSEMIALRAAGIPARRVLLPVAAFGLFGLLLCALCTMVLTPFSYRERVRLANQLAAAQLTAEIQPRVFEEQFPNTILYVQNVIAGKTVRWQGVFLVDVSEPGQRRAAAREAGDGPRITVAAEAVALPDVQGNRLQLLLKDGSTHEEGKLDGEYNSYRFKQNNQVLEARPPREEQAKTYAVLDMGPLWKRRHESVDAQVELHTRLALPVACLVLALIGVPLGVSSRKGGKSGAYVLTVAVALAYWTSQLSLVNLARQGTLPASVALWLPNVVLAVIAAALLARLERAGDRDWVGDTRSWLSRQFARVRGHVEEAPAALGRGLGSRLPALSAVIDSYVLQSFLYYFVLLLASFVAITEVFTFFELLGDMARTKTPMAKMVHYLVMLAPKLAYDFAPIAVLVAVLVTFGIFSKHNEVTAFKACGVSLHRLALPVIFMAAALSGALFAFDYYVVPEANRVQEALRGDIKGWPIQTYLRPDRKWIRGNVEGRIYYYKLFDAATSVMAGVHVYELDPATFRLRRHIAADLARWDASQRTWVFQNGWARDIADTRVSRYNHFKEGTATFAELDEPPGYFLKAVKQDKQMNFHELDGYIAELRQGGFDTVRLQVKYHEKFAVPLFALVMAMISVPFAFLVGNRGAMAGVGFSLAIAIAYWALSSLFEQVGYVNQLPAVMAAWAPVAIFSLTGMYLLARMRT